MSTGVSIDRIAQHTELLCRECSLHTLKHYSCFESLKSPGKVSAPRVQCARSVPSILHSKSDAFASGPVPQKPKCVSEAQRSFMSNTMIYPQRKAKLPSTASNPAFIGEERGLWQCLSMCLYGVNFPTEMYHYQLTLVLCWKSIT